MKKSNSLYPRLPFTSLSRTLLFLMSLSCTLRDDSDPHKDPMLGMHAALKDDTECLNYKSSLDTPLGKVLILLHLDPQKNKTFLQIEDNAFEFAGTGPLKTVCKGDAETLTYLTKLLERSAPGCQISKESDGFVCGMPHKTAAQSYEHIKAVKLALLRQVKRVPYILSRRLTLAENLAFILNRPHWEEGVSAFCGVMEASLPAEKPLILSSRLWREALCKTNPKRLEAALIVLSKAVEEISFMHILQDQVNLPGNLLVHVQTDMLPASGKVWVKLQAANTTMSNVLSAAESVRGKNYEIVSSPKRRGHKKHSKLFQIAQKLKSEAPIPSPKACWFPGFSKKQSLFISGRQMQLWGSHSESPCVQEDKPHEIQKIAQYFMETISAETTFELSETNLKALSLPAGPYHYSVYEFPDKLGAKLETNLVDQGLIVWNGSQQGLTIAKSK